MTQSIATGMPARRPWSKRDPAPRHVGEHAKVAGQAVERVLKRRRPVSLHGEVSHPREAVAEDGEQRQETLRRVASEYASVSKTSSVPAKCNRRVPLRLCSVR
jgi:hypothetical protein